VTSVGTPKAGVFAEGQAAVVAEAIIAQHRGLGGVDGYGGVGQCYLDFGDQVARVEVTFLPGQPPTGDLEGPSIELVAQKAEFGSSRIQRWFDRGWSTR
jgi:sulfide:quinone oxidoreductase